MHDLCRTRKAGYPDEQTAKDALATIRAEEPSWSTRKVPCRVYLCGFCGAWHLTSQRQAHKQRGVRWA